MRYQLNRAIVFPSAIVMLISQSSYSSCKMPGINQLTMGKFRVVSTSLLNVACVDSLKYFGTTNGAAKLGSFKAPGCLINLKRITKAETGFNSQENYVAYYPHSDCSSVEGKELDLSLDGQCCPEQPLICGRDPSIEGSKVGASSEEMACASPRAGHWKIVPNDPHSQVFFEKNRQKYRLSHPSN